MNDADAHRLEAFKAKVVIVKRNGYFTLPAGDGEQVLAFKDGSPLTTALFDDQVQAFQAMWDDFKTHNEIWMRTDDASIFRKLHDAHIAETGAVAFVLEHLWPFEPGAFVFANMTMFKSLAEIEAEVAEENAEV